MLAFAYAFLPSGFERDRMVMYLNCACNELKSKDPAEFDEGDLYSVFVVIVVYSDCLWFDDRTEKIATYLQLFISILKHLERGKLNKSFPSSIFWPVACNLIFNAIRYDAGFPWRLSLQFYQSSRPFSDQRYDMLQNGIRELYRNTNFEHIYVQVAFTHRLHSFCGLLSAVFRSAVQTEYRGLTGHRAPIESYRSDLSYLDSAEVEEMIKDFEQRMTSGYDLYTYSVLLYRNCRLILVLLNAQTIIDGLKSRKGISCGRHWLELAIATDKLAAYFGKRVLSHVICTARLTLSVGANVEGEYFQWALTNCS